MRAPYVFSILQMQQRMNWKRRGGARSLPVRKEGEGAQPFLSQAVGKAPRPDKVASVVTV